MSPLVFHLALNPCHPFSHWASLACRPLSLFLCFSCSIFQICGHDNLSKFNTLDNMDTETISAFRFRLYWLFCCLCFTRRQWLCDFRQNNLELLLGCHTCWLSYFTLVCLWCGRTVSRAGGWCTVTWLPNFLGWVDYFIFLFMVLRWRASRARALLSSCWCSECCQEHCTFWLLPGMGKDKYRSRQVGYLSVWQPLQAHWDSVIPAPYVQRLCFPPASAHLQKF